MQRLLLCACLLFGCGNYPTAQSFVPSNSSPLRLPPEVPQETPAFLISANASVDVPYGAFGITTDGNGWYLEWQTESSARFSGEVFCPQTCVQSTIYFKSSPRGSVTVLTPYHFTFDAKTEANTPVHLEFRATEQPVVFSLQIDGEKATNPKTVFASDQKVSSVSAMPFALVSSNVSKL